MFEVTKSTLPMSSGTATSSTLYVQPIDVDTLISEMWQVCLDQDDESDVDIRAHHDQWWGVYASCSHGNFHGYSNGAIDLSTGFRSLHKAFMEGHGK